MSQLKLDFQPRGQRWYHVSEISVSYKPIVKEPERIEGAKSAYDLIYKCFDQNKIALLEEFKIILLKRNNEVLGVANISQGGVAGTYVDKKIVFGIALKAAASGIIAVHNHPSGNLKPSRADDLLTGDLKKAGDLLDIPLLDHLIITPTYGRYTSYADDNRL